MSKCCKCGVETQETVSANYPGASVYCLACGICAGCGGSVEYFIHVQDLGIWVCPCVAAKRHEVVQEKKIIQFGDMQAKRARKRKNA